MQEKFNPFKKQNNESDLDNRELSEEELAEAKKEAGVVGDEEHLKRMIDSEDEGLKENAENRLKKLLQSKEHIEKVMGSKEGKENYIRFINKTHMANVCLEGYPDYQKDVQSCGLMPEEGKDEIDINTYHERPNVIDLEIQGYEVEIITNELEYVNSPSIPVDEESGKEVKDIIQKKIDDNLEWQERSTEDPLFILLKDGRYVIVKQLPKYQENSDGGDKEYDTFCTIIKDWKGNFTKHARTGIKQAFLEDAKKTNVRRSKYNQIIKEFTEQKLTA